MYSSKEIVKEVKKVSRRRYQIFFATLLFFIMLSFVSLYFIEPKYESSTSILVQKEETLNPLVLYEMAVNIASEDRLKSFNEIIYSRSTMEMLIDSLNLDKEVETEAEKQNLVNSIRNNIKTSSRASDSFEIIFFSTDPIIARDGVQLLAQHFISTRLRLENSRNNETVNFFQAKLNELEKIVDQQRESIVNSTSRQMKELPVSTDALQEKLQNIDSQIESLEWQVFQQEQKLNTLNDFLDNRERNFSVQPFYRLPLEEIPFGEELSLLLQEYDGLNQNFTESYPRLRALRDHIGELAERIYPAMETELKELQMQQQKLKNQREDVINQMEKSFIASQQRSSNQSDYSIYEGLYNEMKVKLEQARMTRDIGNKASEQFVVLDPAYIAEQPSFPDKKLVVSGGLFLGLLVGGMLMALAEVLDSTVRDEEDFEFDKPIIAYLSDGR